MGDNSKKCEAFNTIGMVDFLLTDMQLYLDTHPHDKNAIDYYQYYVGVKKNLVREYEDKYGPITAQGSHGNTVFTWAEEPNAWEGVYG
ncbi:MAG: spore coat protein CotJB [Lachnospiraceae bacterium]|nr:spore coat protein CotJB [Lachnospiraceae bacterium]